MSTTKHSARTLSVEERAETPPMGMVFAYAAMLPLVVGVLAIWFAPDAQSFLAFNLTLFWGAAILMFLAGVRRGVSFRTPGGPHASQLASMLWLFFLGFAALVATIWAYPMTAASLELAGYVSLAILDPMAARSGDAPLFFARLRPVQMAIPIIMLIALMVYIRQNPIF